MNPAIPFAHSTHSLAGAVMCALALLPLALAVWRWRVAERSRAWTRVPAVIVESRVDHTGPNRLRPYLRFRYEVGGRQHESDRIGLGWRITVTNSHSREMVERHPVGTHIFAFHDPRTPGRAVMRTGAGGGVWLQLMVLGLVAMPLLVAGTALLVAT